MSLEQIRILKEDINSMNRFADFYEDLGNNKMRDYYLRKIDNLEIKLAKIKQR